MPRYNEQFPTANMTLDELAEGYEKEIYSLATILQSQYGKPSFAAALDYDAHMDILAGKSFLQRAHQQLAGRNEIYFSKQENLLLEAGLAAHVIVCCELLDGFKVAACDIRHENVADIRRRYFAPYGDLEKNVQERNRLEFALHSADALRTMQIIRGLGLVTRKTSSIMQLSVGVGSGKKDIRSMHLEPCLQLDSYNKLRFGVREQRVGHIVMVDGDPQRATSFAAMSASPEPVHAINDDALQALREMPELFASRSLQLRNLVTGLRIDHRMIPDVAEFLAALVPVLSEESDLVMTIGCGFNLDEFAGRIAVLKSMSDFLASAGLSPLLIKLHGQGALEEQRASQSFGQHHVTTYQILHCRLNKRILAKHLGAVA